MRLREIFKELAKTHLARLLHKPGYESRIREKLGDSVDLLTYQRPLLGALILAESMGSVLFEAGKHTGMELTEGGMPTLEKLPGYRDFAESKNLEEARLSTGYAVLQMAFKTSGTGLIKLIEFRKDKLIVYQVEECSDCWGIKDLNKSVCHFTGGVIAGALEYSLKRTVGFAETMCKAKGDSCCEFKYTIIQEKEQ
jgi:predicted hydrocarbon binding protein